MVAYTSPDCLPYYEGGDSPCVNTGTLCEPSTVMCDMAAIVESRLDAFDDLVARVSTSTPIAWVTRDTPLRDSIGSPTTVSFTSVQVDTDNMVALDVDARTITFTRSGLYQIFFSLRGLSVIATPGDLVQMDATADLSGPVLYPGVGSNAFTAQGAANLGNQHLTINACMTWPCAAGDVLTLTLSGSGTVGDGANWTAIGLGAAWMGDLV